MRFNSKKGLLLAVSALSILASTPAWAGFAQGNQVTLGGQPVFSIQGSADGYSPDHRAWLAQDALDNALVLSADRGPSAVSVGRQNGAIIVEVGGHKVATADSNSAQLAGTTPQALAEQWASGIRSFLQDSSKTSAYVAELTGKNAINARIAIIERRIYAPPGTVLPVAFTTALSSETIAAGQTVQGTLTQDVAFGNYVIPSGATVLGVVNEDQPGAFTIMFNTLKLANGTTIPIAANMTGEFLTGSLSPHLVATEGMPSGERPRYQGVVETDCRIPATIGIGTLGGGRGERLVLRRGSNVVIAAGTPMALVFGDTTQVAVVLRGTHM